ncbi:MAG: Flagellar hook-length control protein FliK [Rhodospirillaceae bacterium]|nr:MAG: Flagellar hook-length control protein FliK [Rhodospirillaceae bacterium]
MGEDGTVDLGTTDYSDAGYWKRFNPPSLPEGLNVSDSNSMAIGGLVVRNDVRGEVESFIQNATVTAGSVAVTAVEDATIKAIVDAEVSSSGGSAFGEGKSLAVNGVIATNLVLSSADARIKQGSVTTTTGDVTVTAENTSWIDAKNLSSVASGQNGVSVTLAFNTIGWEAQNILFQAIDTLIGDTQPARVSALIEDTSLAVAGAVTVSATSEARIHATVSNETESKAVTLSGGDSMAVGAVLASNLVKMAVDAKISAGSVTASGAGVSVSAVDDASIVANSKMSAISATISDGGLNLVYKAFYDTLGLDYTDRSGTRAVQIGDIVRLDDVDYTTNDEPDSLTGGNRVQLAFDIGGGAAGDEYEYVGAADIEGPVDLDGEDYTDTTRWKKLTGAAGGVYIALGAWSSVDLANEDFSDTARWTEMITIDPTVLIPGLSLNLTNSDSSAFGGLVVRNDVRGSVTATVVNASVQAAEDVVVLADESASIRAQDDSTVTSSGGSMFGKGKSMAVNAHIATNLVLSGADAHISGSTTSAGGSVEVVATNTATIDAIIASTTEANGHSIGVTLAFNSVGFDSQNVLFNAVDALIGTSLGDENPVKTVAFIENSQVTAAAGIRVEAIAAAHVHAVITSANATYSVTPAGGSDTISIGAVIALNRIATQTDARIGDDSLGGLTRALAGDIVVTAADNSWIASDVRSSSVAVGAGAEDSSGLSIGFASARN